MYRGAKIGKKTAKFISYSKTKSKIQTYIMAGKKSLKNVHRMHFIVLKSNIILIF